MNGTICETELGWTWGVSSSRRLVTGTEDSRAQAVAAVRRHGAERIVEAVVIRYGDDRRWLVRREA